MSGIIFITGTDTSVGKTLLTALLLCHLRRKGIHALAMKPFCCGDRGDVEFLQKFQPGELTNDVANPFYFKAPLAPFVATKKRRRKIKMNEVVEKITSVKARCDLLLVEGVGGVMVPLGENFFIRDLIQELTCNVVLVAKNSLGTINHSLLSVSALHIAYGKELVIILMEQPKDDISSKSNSVTIAKLLHPTRVISVPFFGKKSIQPDRIKKTAKKLEKKLDALLSALYFNTTVTDLVLNKPFKIKLKSFDSCSRSDNF
ncbi:MAG: dethiobiotin synthase [Verrucomicrobiota bacterium]